MCFEEPDKLILGKIYIAEDEHITSECKMGLAGREKGHGGDLLTLK